MTEAPNAEPQNPENAIDYVEIPVLNVEEAKEFYGAVFGWSFADYGEYTTFFDGRLYGGLYAAPQVAAGGPLVVVYSSDLETMKEKVAAAGGEVVREREFPGGRRFHFKDPSGNELAVWTDR